MNRILLVVLMTIFITSCRTQKDVLYFQNINEVINDSSPEIYKDPTIQTGDALSINVSSLDPKLAMPFNLNSSQSSSSSNRGINNYIVDSEGYIIFPMIGKILVKGKTRNELSSYLSEKISKWVTDPIVNIRIDNFRVIMLGEVGSPGVIKSDSEKLSIVEAIAMSGDLTLNSIRDSVMLIRTVDNVRTKKYINLKDAQTINSPDYYLKQNDIVYVMPTKSKTYDFNAKPLQSILTVLGFALTIYALFK